MIANPDLNDRTISNEDGSAITSNKDVFVKLKVDQIRLEKSDNVGWHIHEIIIITHRSFIQLNVERIRLYIEEQLGLPPPPKNGRGYFYVRFKSVRGGMAAIEAYHNKGYEYIPKK